MNFLRKVLIIVLIIGILFGPVPLYQHQVMAAAVPVNIYVESFKDGNLTINWDQIVGAKSFALTYHTPESGLQTIQSNENVNTYQIPALQNDIIYDIRVEIYNDLNLGGSKIGEGLLYFLPRISFYASRIQQTRQAVAGGGYEIGDKPRLNLRWIMPKVWDGDSGEFRYAHETDSVEFVKNNLNAVYSNNIDVTTLNFKINISSSLSTLNSGSSQSSLIIDYGSPNYTVYVSGNQNNTANVSGPDINGYMSFDLIGRKDLNTPLPAAEQYGLPDGDIIPGTVFYMNVKLAYENDAGSGRYIASVGKPSDLNGSILMGAYPYTYTPIRFQLSKDAADNIYVKVYKVNQGSLDLPRLFYEIQSSDDQTIQGDWSIKKIIDDSFFAPGAESAITLISGVGPNNKIYYKIVVKTDTTSDRLESMAMDYTLAEDTSKSPVPKGITVIDRRMVTRTEMINGLPVIQKSSDITISWEKPANWDEIRANSDKDKDVVFHILMNTNQTEVKEQPYPELKADGKIYGYFPLMYRRVLYFSSKEVTENGNRLEYTIRGFGLFKGSYFDGVDADGLPIIVEEDIANLENYPAFLLSNKVYYMQMYTTNTVNRNSNELEDMSDKSVIVSFTTRAGEEIDVPLPKNLRLNKNEADVTIGETTTVSNFVELQFDKVDISWSNYTPDTSVTKAVYYDLYMSTRTDLTSFRLIGTTQYPDRDLGFIGADDAQSTSVRVVVREFSQGTTAYTAFGSKLRPNTTYYFVARTRLATDSQDADKESAFTTLLPVTTVKGVIDNPDETSKRPLAPTDFTIAADSNGNPMITGTKVTFSWTREETDVVYNIICSSRKLEVNEGLYTGENDAIFQSFKAAYGEIVLDPSLDTLPYNFEFNPVSKECKFTVDKWLFPNRLYYFSIKAVKKADDSVYSSWVSIPVTTTLIQQPGYLEAVTDVQLGFFFNDDDTDTRAEDYNVYIKAENDLKYTFLNKNRYTFVKYGTTCYIRLTNLKADTYYDVKVYKDNDNTLVYVKEELLTRDSCHQIEIKWRGLPGYKYELTIKTLTDNNYTILKDENLEEYINPEGRIQPYYTEKTVKTSGTDYEYYNARIKTIPVRLSDGSYEQQPLKSNTKYYIKVRAIKIDPVDPSIVSYSKYLGPVSIRTEFNQDDYDEEDMNTRKKASFLDKIKKLEEALYWRINIGSGASNKLLLKGDRIVNAIENNGPYPFTLDISHYAQNSLKDTVYIPVSVIEALDTVNKSLVIRTSGAEYTFRPDTLELESRLEVNELKEKKNVNEIYFMVNIGRMENPSKSLPQGLKAVSKINDLELEALGTSITYKQFKSQIDDRIYNKDSGLVQQKLGILMDKATSSGLSSKQLETMVAEMIYDIELELSEFIYYKMEGGNGVPSVVVSRSSIKEFDNPVLAKLSYTEESGLKLPYVRYDDASGWLKLSQNAILASNSMAFNIIKTGEISVLLKEEVAIDLPDNYILTPDIKLLLSRYDLSEVFGDMSSFYPEDRVKVKEIIILYGKLTGKEPGSSGLTVNQKAQKYGLENLISFGGVLREVSRQETARVVMMVYSSKTGVNIDSLIPNRSSNPGDLKDVDEEYYKDVLIAVDLGVLELSNGSRFNPDVSISRGELASAFVKVLKLTGDI